MKRIPLFFKTEELQIRLSTRVDKLGNVFTLLSISIQMISRIIRSLFICPLL